MTYYNISVILYTEVDTKYNKQRGIKMLYDEFEMRTLDWLIEDLRDFGSVKDNIGIYTRLDEIQDKINRLKAENEELKNKIMKLTHN